MSQDASCRSPNGFTASAFFFIFSGLTHGSHQATLPSNKRHVITLAMSQILHEAGILWPACQEFCLHKKVEEPKLGFEDLGLSPESLKAVKSVNYVTPSPIQAAFIPVALKGGDVTEGM